MFFKQLQILHDYLEKNRLSHNEYIDSVIHLAEFHFTNKKCFICKETRSDTSLTIQLKPLQMYWKTDA